MEINLNCDLGEKSIHCSGKNDKKLLKIVNSVNIACGYHGGNVSVMNETIKKALENNVSLGAHPSFNDLENFGRKKIYLSAKEISKLIWIQLEIIKKIADKYNANITHVKPHGALNNMACDNYDIAFTIGEAIKSFNKDLIYVVLPLNEMEKAAKKLNIRYACEIFADRNYEDNGQLVSREKDYALIEDSDISSKNVIEMLNSSSILCYSGKKIKCDIDTICIHGDNKHSVTIARDLKISLIKNGFSLINLNKMTKFQ